MSGLDVTFLGYDRDGHKVWRLPDRTVVGDYDSVEQIVSERVVLTGGYTTLAAYERVYGKVEGS